MAAVIRKRGAGAIIIKDGNVLLLKRGAQARSARGMWSRPGGEVNPGEAAEEGAVREVREETGLLVEIVRPLDLFEHTTDDGTAWQARGFLASVVRGELENREPDRHDEVRWFPLDALPENLTAITLNAIDVYLTEKGEWLGS